MYFSLKESNGSKDTLIVLRYFISKKEGRFVFSTGLTISPKDWEKNTKMAKGSRGRSDLSTINRKLQEYVTFLEKTLNHLELNNTDVTRLILKEKFTQEYRPNASNTSRFIYFTDFVKDFTEKAIGITNRSTNRKYSPSKIKHYTKTYNRLTEFEAYRKAKIKMEQFNLTVYDEFVDYFMDIKGYSVNYTGDIVKNIKVFLKRAEEGEYDVHKDYKKQTFSAIKEESISIALSEDEIQKMLSHDFSTSDRLQNCRDLAIIGLWTGLRVSDLLSLPSINEADRFITVQPKKTKDSSGVKVVIPLHHHIKEVLQKRGMPRMISDVKFNVYIKEVCEKVKINQLVQGSLMDPETKRKKVGMFPKHKLISSHTCRRSFATNLYKMNFPSLSIMKITGHSSEKTFLSYIKVTPTEHAEKLLEHWENYYSK